MKDKLLNALGTFGGILWMIISLVIYVLPIVMLGTSFLLDMLFLGVMYWFPPSSVVFWIIGLVCAIKGPQDIIAIIYYIAFVVMFLPFFISVVSSFFSRK